MTSATVTQRHDPQAMSPAAPPHPSPAGDPLPAGGNPFALQGKIYAIRTAYSVMALAMLVSGDILCDTQFPENGWLLFVLVIYPHLGHLLFGRFDIRRLRGRTLLLADGLFAGAIIAVLGIAGTPAAAIVAINLFNWMVIGGPALVFTGSLAMFAGFAGMVANSGLANHVTSDCTAPAWLASFFLAAYLLIVAGVIRRLVQELGQHQLKLQAETDTARRAEAMAASALLSALPPSTARQYSDRGEIVPEAIDDATLLLLRFETGPTCIPTLELLAEYMHVGNLVLARHGFELLKTFGGSALAASRAATGPENGIAAVGEISAYFAAHAAENLSVAGEPAIRAALSCGTARLGLVQDDRFNLEITGDAMVALNALAIALDIVPGTRCVITPAVRQRLRDPGGFAFFPGDGRLPPHYRTADGGTLSR